MKQFLFLLFIIAASVSCGDKPAVVDEPVQTKFCWKITDFNLILITTVCDKTEAEVAAEYPNNYYYKSDEPLKCWYSANSNTYLPNCPLSLLTKVAPGKVFVQVNCGYCAFWYHREKKKYLPNNSITYGITRVERLCGDTVLTLFRGREVFLRQSTDSIIVRQFSDNGNDW